MTNTVQMSLGNAAQIARLLSCYRQTREQFEHKKAPVMPVTLYIGNKNYSSWSLRGWLAMKKSGVDFEEVTIPLRQDDSKSRINAVSMGGQVPALHADGVPVFDSLAIAEWAAEQNKLLWPHHPDMRAQARSAVALMHSGFAALRAACPMNMKITNGPKPNDEAALADAARIDRLWCDWLDMSEGPWLFGNWSIADAFYAPIVSRFVTWSLPASTTAQAYIELTEAETCYSEWKSAGLAESWTIPDIDRLSA